MSTSLLLDNVSKRYGDVLAVRDLALRVEVGEFVTLLGPSGSGKTTLLKLIAGFELPSSGDIKLGDQSVVDLPSHRRGIGMVFQNYALFPHMTVFENIAFPLSVRGASRELMGRKVADVLTIVRLEGLEERFPHQLSGGQQQRVALARAVIFDPGILLMDEPLGALDRSLREQMKVEIKRVQRALNMTVVYVTHDQDEALAMSDRIAVMRDGALEQVAPWRLLYERPRTAFVARFIGESNLIPCWIDPNPGDSCRLLLEDGTFIGYATGARHKSSATVLIRPERICIDSDRDVSASSQSDNGERIRLSGRVSETLFLGETTRCRVSVGALELVVKLQSRYEEYPVNGANVVLSWSSRDIALVDD